MPRRPGILAAADLGRFGTVMDVRGGDGTLIAEALKSHRELAGPVFDLSVGLASAAATLEAAGVAERCGLVRGDFFVSVREGADAYLLKQVLHDWDDERAATILRSVRRSMRAEARVLVVEQMLPELVDDADAPTLLLDVLMLAVTGGRERTEAEFRNLLDGAGLELTAVTEPIPPFACRVLEAAPAPLG